MDVKSLERKLEAARALVVTHTAEADAASRTCDDVRCAASRAEVPDSTRLQAANAALAQKTAQLAATREVLAELQRQHQEATRATTQRLACSARLAKIDLEIARLDSSAELPVRFAAALRQQAECYATLVTLSRELGISSLGVDNMIHAEFIRARYPTQLLSLVASMGGWSHTTGDLTKEVRQRIDRRTAALKQERAELLTTTEALEPTEAA